MHSCTKCGKTYEDGKLPKNFSCQCGNSRYSYHGMYVERDKIVKEINSILGEEQPLDIHSIKIVKDGMYELNLTKLLNQPIIIQVKQEGKYLIHLPSLFKDTSKSLSTNDLEDKK